MTKGLKETEPTKKTLLDELLERHGFKKVEPPKDFVRVIIPGIPWSPSDGSPPNKEKP